MPEAPTGQSVSSNAAPETIAGKLTIVQLSKSSLLGKHMFEYITDQKADPAFDELEARLNNLRRS